MYGWLAYNEVICPAKRILQDGRPPAPMLNLSRRHLHQEIGHLKNLKKSRSRSIGYALLVVPISTLLLGMWQIRRRQWKLDLIKDLDSRISEPPVSLPEDYKELQNMEYRKVRVTGIFDHSRESYILPRMNVHTSDKIHSSSGLYVVTPFHLQNNEDIILVNRGWVPRDKMNPITRTSGQVEGIIDIIGVVRGTEQRPNYISSHDLPMNVWHIRDVIGLANHLGTLPIFIDADIGSTVEGGPVGGQTKVTMRNDHMQYIITWFSLSAATFYMWLKWYLRKF